MLKVERPKMTLKRLARCPKEFARLDRRLAIALGKILKGELGRHVDVEEQRAIREKQTFLPGRRKLCRTHDNFGADESLVRCHTMHDLCSVKRLGNGQIEALQNT